MKTFLETIAVQTLKISCDGVKLNLSIDRSSAEADSATIRGSYPEHANLSLIWENGGAVVKIAAGRTWTLGARGECTLAICLPHCFGELVVNASQAKIHLGHGRVENYRIDLALGSVTVADSFEFAVGEINSSAAEVQVRAASCYQRLTVNVATGSVLMSLPDSERSQYSRNGVRQLLGNAAGPTLKLAEVNSLAARSTVSTYPAVQGAN
jgi:hypothetical protein